MTEPAHDHVGENSQAIPAALPLVNIELNCSVPPLDISGDPAALATKWKRWKRGFEYFLKGKGVQSGTQKRALLLHLAGSEVQDIFETLADTGTDDQYEVAVTKLDDHFTPQKNIPFERHVFRQLKQEENESTDQYITRLRQKAVYCNFDNVDECIRDQVIDKCRSAHLCRKFLEKGGVLTLKQMQEIARASEAAQAQAKTMEASYSSQGKGSSGDRIYTVKPKKTQPNHRDGTRSLGAKSSGHGQGHQKQRTFQDNSCWRCARSGHYAKDCPSRELRCHRCGNIGHIAPACHTKMNSQPKSDRRDQRAPSKKGRKQDKTYTVSAETENDSENEYVFSITNLPSCTVYVQKKPVECMVDSCSSCNVMNVKDANKLKVKLKPCNRKLYPYGNSEPLKVVGSFDTEIAYNESSVYTEFVVVDHDSVPLLGKESAVDLGILSLNINSVNDKSDWKAKYPSVFSGVGKLKDFQLKLHVDENIIPVAQPQCHSV